MRGLHSYLEIVRTGRQKLIANMKSPGGIDATEVSLTGTDTPGLVANVDEDVVSTCSLIRYVRRTDGSG